MANLLITKEKHLPSDYNSDMDLDAPEKEKEEEEPYERKPWLGRRQTFDEACDEVFTK